MSTGSLRRARRATAAVVIGVLAVFAIAACGSSKPSSPSSSIPANDPAHMAPASSVFFASVNAPSGSSNLKGLEAVVDKFGGPGTATKLFGQLKKSISAGGPSYEKTFAGWFDGKFGVAFTQWPKSFKTEGDVLKDTVVIFPTTNTAAAKKAIPALDKGAPSFVTGQIVGNYLLLGGKQAVAAAAAASKSSLADSAQYKTDAAKLPAGPPFTVYVNVKSLKPVLARLAVSQGKSASMFSKLLTNLGPTASEMFTLSATAQAVSLNTTSQGIPKKSAASSGVGVLPAEAWLALAIPAISESRLRDLVEQLDAMMTASSVASTGGSGTLHSITTVGASYKTQGTGIPTAYFKASHARAVTSSQLEQDIRKSVDKSITSGLGPITFALGGTSLTDLHAGLQVQADGDLTGKKMLTYVYNLVKTKAGNVKITGSPKQGAFTITLGAIFSIRVSDDNNSLVATLGYPNDAAFTSPSAQLSSSALYKKALAALPAGSKPTIYLNFSGLSLLSELASMGGGGAQVTEVFKTLDKMQYLIAGAAGGDSRVVLGLR